MLATTIVVAMNASTSFDAFAAPPKKPAPATPKAAPAAAAPKPAPPKPTPATPASTKAYDEGVALFRAGSYEAALAVFKKLTNIESRRGAAFALEKLGRNEEAIAEFEAFIAGAPASLEDQVKAARTRVAELSATRKAKIHVVTTPAGATVDVAGHPSAHGTSPVDLELPPGKHVVRATLVGNDPAEREIEVTAGSTVQEVRLELAPAKTATAAPVVAPAPLQDATATGPQGGAGMAPDGTPRPPAKPGIERMGAPILTGVLAGLSLGAGVYFGLSALSKKSDYDKEPTEARLADGENDAALSTAALGAGVVLGAITVVLLLTSPSADNTPPKGPAASIRGNGLNVRF